jgi:hypothetical protein
MPAGSSFEESYTISLEALKLPGRSLKTPSASSAPACQTDRRRGSRSNAGSPQLRASPCRHGGRADHRNNHALAAAAVAGVPVQRAGRSNCQLAHRTSWPAGVAGPRACRACPHVP